MREQIQILKSLQGDSVLNQFLKCNDMQEQVNLLLEYKADS